MQIVEDEAGQKVDVPEGKILIPVYDLQVEMMKGTLKGIEVLPKEVSLQAQAQASLRSVFSYPLSRLTHAPSWLSGPWLSPTTHMPSNCP